MIASKSALKQDNNASSITVHDFSPRAIRKALKTYAANHWSTKYSASFFVVAVLGGLFFAFSETIFAAIIVTFGASCLSWVYHFFLRAGHFEHKYVEKLQKAIQEETDRKRQTLSQELIELGCKEGAKQLDEFRRKFNSLIDLLGDKLDQKELTFKRYYGIAQEVYLSGIDNLSMIVSALKSISEIEESPIEARIQQLRAYEDPESREEVNALTKRLNIKKDQKNKIKHLLIENEKAMTLIDETQVAIADMDTGLGEAKIDMENSMKALEEIAKRSQAYSVR